MKNTKHRLPLTIACALLATVVLGVSCVSSGGTFYDSNVKTISRMSLDNGIPLIVKKSDVNRVFSFKVVIDGGSSMIPAAKAGVEAVGLTMLRHGSSRFTYADIQAALYEKSAVIGSQTGYDYSSFELMCIDGYFDELFDMFADSFLSPKFEAAEFENVMNDAVQVNAERMGNPDEYGRVRGTQAIFALTPYAADPKGTSETLGAITLDDVKAWYAAALDADRLSIIAVGNFDPDRLFEKLNAAFGALPRKGGKPPVIPVVTPTGPMIREAHKAAQDVAYMQGFFRIPDYSQRDYIPFAIAMSMLDDLCFNIVREKYGACYTVRTLLRPGRLSYGIFLVYRTTRPDSVKSYVDEAVSLLAHDKLILMKDAAGKEYIYTTIGERLEAYKNKYVTMVYNAQRTNGDIGDSITRSLVYFGDPAEYLRAMDKISAVSAADIKRVLAAFLLGGTFRWVVVSDDAGLAAVDEKAYDKFVVDK